MSERTESNDAEIDYRLNILDTFLQTPHGDFALVLPVFDQLHRRDPVFLGRLACWYCRHGNVRDLPELFIAHMCVSEFEAAYREAGLAMPVQLPPYQVAAS